MENKKLTEKPEIGSVTEDALIHVVEPSDLSQGPSGSSYKFKIKNLIIAGQDNIDIKKYVTILSTDTIAEIVDKINLLTPYTVDEKQSVWFITRQKSSMPYTPQRVLKFKMMNNGKGTYGAGEIQLEVADVELVYSNVESTADLEEDPTTDIIDFGDIADMTISEWLNFQDPAIVIQSQEDGYTIFQGTIDEVPLTYLWIGEPGVYGVDETQTTMADFQLLSNSLPPVGVLTVTGDIVDNTDPENPVIIVPDAQMVFAENPDVNLADTVNFNVDTLNYNGSEVLSAVLVGANNGIASLDSNGKVPLSEINDALLGNVKWMGIYDGTTILSSPDAALVGQPLPDAAEANTGWYFISQGDYTNGGVDYKTGDWIISDGTAWNKVDNTDAVSSVNGMTGNVVISMSDISGLVAALANKITQGGDSFGVPMVINTADNQPVEIQVGSALKAKFSNLGIELPTGSVIQHADNAGYFKFIIGETNYTSTIERNTSGARSVLRLRNSNQSSTGYCLEIESNIGGSTLLRSGARKDGRFWGPNAIVDEDYVPLAQLNSLLAAYVAVNAILQGGNALGETIVIGSTDNQIVNISASNQLFNFTSTGFLVPQGKIIGNVTTNQFALSVGTAGSSATASRNLADAISVLKIQNSHPSSTGNIVEFASNISGSTITRAGVRKDGRVWGANASVDADFVTLDQAIIIEPASPVIIKKEWFGTEAQYAALTPAADTAYFIEDSQSPFARLKRVTITSDQSSTGIIQDNDLIGADLYYIVSSLLGSAQFAENGEFTFDSITGTISGIYAEVGEIKIIHYTK